MEIKVTVELGPQTFALINGFSTAKALEMPKQVVETAEEVAPLAEKPKQTRTRATAKVEPSQDEAPKEVAAPVEEVPASTKPETFTDLDDDAKLDAIKAEVTKHTKKGKSADIKALLGGFNANRASELASEDYDAFFDGVKRYGAGESVDDIIGLA